MSLERHLHLPPRAITEQEKLDFPKERLAQLQAYQREGSSTATHNGAFSAGMPGLVPLDDLTNTIDLDIWPVKLGNMIAELGVSYIPCKTPSCVELGAWDADGS